jgi:molybdopterin/thiamine biosynthesis adenylyltransferase
VVAEQQTKEVLKSIVQQSKGKYLSLAAAQNIAAEFECSLNCIERIALDNLIVPARFKRNSLSCPEQLRLLQSRVSIIGCGGLGGRIAELLARLGIGHLILTDPDNFSESNLNRQIFCTIQTLGLNKIEVLAKELGTINPTLEFTLNINKFNKDSIATANIVVDGLDSPAARKSLSALCQKQNIPLVHGAVKEWYGQAGVEEVPGNLINTLYPDSLQTSQTPPLVLPMTVALIASIQASETCKCLLNLNSPLRGNFLQTDLLRQEYETIPFDC